MGEASTLLGNLVYLRACKLRPGTVLELQLMMLHVSVRTKWTNAENSCGNLNVLLTAHFIFVSPQQTWPHLRSHDPMEVLLYFQGDCVSGNLTAAPHSWWDPWDHVTSGVVTGNVGDDAWLLLSCLFFVLACTNSVTSLNIHPGNDGRSVEREGAPKAALVETSVSPVMTGTREGALFRNSC